MHTSCHRFKVLNTFMKYAVCQPLSVGHLSRWTRAEIPSPASLWGIVGCIDVHLSVEEHISITTGAEQRSGTGVLCPVATLYLMCTRVSVFGFVQRLALNIHPYVGITLHIASFSSQDSRTNLREVRWAARSYVVRLAIDSSKHTHPRSQASGFLIVLAGRLHACDAYRRDTASIH